MSGVRAQLKRAKRERGFLKVKCDQLRARVKALEAELAVIRKADKERMVEEMASVAEFIRKGREADSDGNA